VALADIIKRIKADSDAEVAGIAAAAQARADSIIGDAQKLATARADEVIAAAVAGSSREAGTVVVNARLAARDAEVTARRQLLHEALQGVTERLSVLPDAQYAAFLAPLIVSTARGGETLAFGTEDTGRASQVIAEVSRIAPALSLQTAEQPAPFPYGALLEGDRVRSDLSLSAIVDERRDDLEVVAARVLFPEEA
jgi:vacuolar-type H+-ATPase subunit E/Vma4